VLSWAQRYELLSLDKHDNRAFIYDNVDVGAGLPAQMLAGPQFADGGPEPVPEPPTTILAGVVLIGASLAGRHRLKTARPSDGRSRRDARNL
jgi:PEP-CTERM motif-containing protein